MVLSSRPVRRLLFRSLAGVLILGAGYGAAAQSPPSEQATGPSQAEPPAVAQRSGNLISITGYVAASTVEALKQALAAPDGAKIETLVIESTSADIDPLLELGRMIRARGLALKVNRVCALGCATYLAPAAEQLIVPSGTFLVTFPLLDAQKHFLAQAAGTADEKTLQEALERQASYFRELGLDPDLAFGLGETALVVKAALAAAGRPDQPLIVPDAAYLRKCLRISSVEMQDYTVADSVAFAHVSQDVPLAFLIGGKIYYEGKEIATYAPSCSAR